MKKTVLIVEDVEMVRDLLATVLETEYQIMQAGTGRQALEQMTMVQPDLVLLDIGLPGDLSGLEVCMMIRANADLTLRRLPVLILSGLADALDVKVARAVGANAYLTKPYSPVQLLEMVARLLAEVESP